MEKQSYGASKFRLREKFSKNNIEYDDIPNLIHLQKDSFKKFLQMSTPWDERKVEGLEKIFKSVFPIENTHGTLSLEYVGYHLSPPRYSEYECLQRGVTYAAPFKVTFRLVSFDVDEATGSKQVRDIREQEVYMSEAPLMTEGGSFIVNGTERVIVSQLHRSPGVFFGLTAGGSKTTAISKDIYSARLIPYRGSWLDFAFDQKDLIQVRIDRRRKFPVTVLLKALGYSSEEILKYFYKSDEIQIKAGGRLTCNFDPERLEGQRSVCDIKTSDGKVLVKKGRRLTRFTANRIKEAKIKTLDLKDEDLDQKTLMEEVVHPKTGEVLAEFNTDLTPSLIKKFAEAGVKKIEVIFFDIHSLGPYLRNTLLMEKITSQDEAILEVYKRLRPSDVPNEETAKKFFHRLFFSEETYDLGEVGRVKINHRFGIPFDKVPSTVKVLREEDIMLVVKTLIDLKSGYGEVDDIDHLGNRRVRSVGELLENQYRLGLNRMERYIKEKMNLQDAEALMPNDFINVKPLNVVVREFVTSGQLSQFMDQTNPLAEITHKRRLSALGPGGLARNRAGFEVRDVHPTHYGRICPIETPDGPNVGLISSLAMFARVNNYGFIETPYFPIQSGKLSRDVKYLSAFEEQGHHIAQASKGVLASKLVDDEYNVRHNGEYEVSEKEKVTLMDVSSGQLVSVASSLIPFLEHDDANRALMGANMQRQAVPLMRARAPLVGTGVEKVVATDSGCSLVAISDGVVESVDALRIVVRRLGRDGSLGKNVDIYDLVKTRRTNQNTCFNHKAIVNEGDFVYKNDVLADGPSTDKGELAIAQNVLVAFTPWMGYNFEDSILISERLVKDDTYTSIHIEEFDCQARDTKLGPEEITQDIAHVGESALKNLDASGIIRIGSEVKPGDILVGKVTPKGAVQLAPEEKLLLAIFGEKASEYQDTSTRVPSGVHGTIVDIQVYNREGVSKDARLKEIVEEKKIRIEKDKNTQVNAIRNAALDQLKSVLVGAKTESVLLSEDGEEELLKEGQTLKESDLESVSFPLLAYIPLKPEIESRVTKIMNQAKVEEEDIGKVYDDKIQQLHEGDELPAGVIKMVRVYVAIKRKLQVGDKLAGRHGNKGVISRVLPEEDMPYLSDGRPVDMVLNPLGVPSRMNIGQVLECHFGWAAYGLGQKIQEELDNFDYKRAKELMASIHKNPENKKFIDSCDEKALKRVMKDSSNGVHLATPVFDGASETDVKELLKKADLDPSGQTILFDGRTGEPFKCPVTVGVMYMLKLNHLVEEKIHARSIGPYSLVSQQPLGGKSQFGGQRFGEMEVWAIEAYGAAYSLQEFLTVKSDDVAGRVRIYESIIKGENELEPGLPESFNVLVKELQSLALNVNIIESDILTEKPKASLMEEQDI